jgi:hypothetical protein
MVPITIGDADGGEIDPRLGMLHGFTLDGADAAARIDSLAAKVLAGRGSEAGAASS